MISKISLIESNFYDIIFSGWGASACILLNEMDKQNLLSTKKVLIIDPSEKLENDKTFCFWSTKEEDIFKDYRLLISNQWSGIQINNSQPESISPQFYFHINSIDLYDKARSIIEKYTIKVLVGKITRIQNGAKVKVKSSEGSFTCSYVFDSRSIDFEKIKKSNHFIYQSFFGLKIRLKHKVFDESVYRMMDFRVSQQVATQFVYILPYDSTSALIELTRFGKKVIHKALAKQQLIEYIHNYFGEHEVIADEFGVIPMASHNFKSKKSEKVIQIGTRAGSVKPSTGYAFKNMYTHAKAICSDGIQSKNITINKRFAFYDQLLLIILSKWPQMGKPIFERLFSKKRSFLILKFLDEKTSIREDLSIFGKLQIGVFLKALCYWFFNKLKPSIVAILFIVSIFLFENNSSSIFLTDFQLGLLSFGLLLVGIPHGALDHLTETISKKKKITFSFISKYLLLMVPIFFLWYYQPLLGLVFFLIYSAWHFGQTDMNYWKIKSNWLSMFWGVSLLGYMLFSHLDEFIVIVQYLGVNFSDNSFPVLIFSKILLLSSFLIAFFKRKLNWMLWCVFLLLSTKISLLLTFGIYFIFHHSRIGWMDLKANLKTSHFNMFVKAIPFNVGAVAIYFLFFVKGGFSLQQNISYFFIFLSCISFPHIICMSLFYKK